MAESSPIQTPAKDMLDLWDRLTTARSKLNMMADDAILDGSEDVDRLQGKAEGIGLALSYLDEVIRER
jgi:hypothetical protein